MSKNNARYWLGKHFSDEHKKNLSISLKGRKKLPFTEQHKNNISRTLKGKPNGRLGTHLSEKTKEKISEALKGHKGYWLEKTRSKEAKINMSLARLRRKEELGYINSPETRKKMKNRIWTEEMRENMSIAKKNLSKETRLKMSLSRIGTHPSEETRKKMGLKHSGEKAWNWKGDKAGKVAFHIWVGKRKPKPKLCEFCENEKDYLGHTKLVLSNINNHIYTRNPEHYKWGHYSCHSKFDFPDSLIGKNLKK